MDYYKHLASIPPPETTHQQGFLNRKTERSGFAVCCLNVFWLKQVVAA